MSISLSDEQQSETDEENLERNANEESLDNVTARPRDHAYLPTSHPLHTSLSLRSSAGDVRSCQFSARASNIQELLVLELTGILLFPGSVFPLRFSQSDSAWVEYLGRQIRASRQSPGQAGEVRLGILAAKPPPELERAASLDRRRHSWTRQAFGPDRLRRLSMQLIRELGDLDELSEVDDDEDEQLGRDGSGDANAQSRETGVSPTAQPPSVHSTMNALGRQRDRCGYIGRIGTIVTVMNTHGDEAGDLLNSSSSSVWQSVNDQLVLTTLATSRFRILGYSHPDDEGTMYQRVLLQRSFRRSFPATVPTFIVEIIDESPNVIPCIQRPISTGPTKKQKTMRNDKMVSSYAMITPFPEFVYRKLWPHRLVSLIREEMASSQTFRVFLQSLPTSEEKSNNESIQNLTSDTIPSITLHDDTEEDDPVKMSFWLASNLPLREDDKFRLLEMHSAVERLEYIYQKVKEQSEPFICCQSCGVPLSRASYMFTVGGAEGTTGAYVNEHGFVHQTLTVRRLLSLGQNSRSSVTQNTSSDDESEVVFFAGGPQTKDSWFPGYSWTIMCCSLCNSHLGWKFLRVKRNREETPSNERPDQFYGLSGASVNIAIPQ